MQENLLNYLKLKINESTNINAVYNLVNAGCKHLDLQNKIQLKYIAFCKSDNLKKEL